MTGALVVSFGTSFAQTRQKNITKIEQTIATLGIPVYSAFTSKRIIQTLGAQGNKIDDIATALSKMQQDGITNVLALPTFVSDSAEYLAATTMLENHSFCNTKIATPLLANNTDIEITLTAIAQATNRQPDEALVLVGHGSKQDTTTLYDQITTIGHNLKIPNFFYCTLEGAPSFDDVKDMLLTHGISKAVLVPLLLACGRHATLDIKEQLVPLLRTHGIASRQIDKGLAEYPEILTLYLQHFTALR